MQSKGRILQALKQGFKWVHTYRVTEAGVYVQLNRTVRALGVHLSGVRTGGNDNTHHKISQMPKETWYHDNFEPKILTLE